MEHESEIQSQPRKPKEIYLYDDKELAASIRNSLDIASTLTQDSLQKLYTFIETEETPHEENDIQTQENISDLMVKVGEGSIGSWEKYMIEGVHSREKLYRRLYSEERDRHPDITPQDQGPILRNIDSEMLAAIQEREKELSENDPDYVEKKQQDVRIMESALTMIHEVFQQYKEILNNPQERYLEKFCEASWMPEAVIIVFAGKEIRKIADIASGSLSGPFSQWKFEVALEKTIGKNGLSFDRSTDGKIVQSVHDFPIFDEMYGYSDHKAWVDFKNKDIANEIFGERLSQIDKRIYERILNHPDPDISTLILYPTPEVLHLLTLRSLSGFGESRTSMQVLLKALHDPSFEKAIHEAEAKYSLSDVFSYLRKNVLEDEQSINYEELRELGKQFLLNAFYSENKQESHRGISGLSATSLLELAEEKGVLKPVEIEYLQILSRAGIDLEGLRSDLLPLITRGDARDELVSAAITLGKILERHIDNERILSFVKIEPLRLMIGLRNNQIDEDMIERFILLPQKFTGLTEPISDYRLKTYPSFIIDHAQLFLSDDSGVDFFGYIYDKYLEAFPFVDSLFWGIKKGELTKELILEIPNQAPLLLKKEYRQIRDAIIQNPDLKRSVEELRFINTLIGKFGKKAAGLVEGYVECLSKKTISMNEKDLILEFTDQFAGVTPEIIAGYKKAKKRNSENLFIAQIKLLSEKMSKGEPLTDVERKSPLYKGVLEYVYPNNSVQFGAKFEYIATCSDRSSDIEPYAFDKRYQMDLLEHGELYIKEGEVLSTEKKDALLTSIKSTLEGIEDVDTYRTTFEKEVDNAFSNVDFLIRNPKLDAVSLSIEEKMMLLLIHVSYSEQVTDIGNIKKIFKKYGFMATGDGETFFETLMKKSNESSDPDYGLYCQLSEFYNDRLKDVTSTLLDNVSESRAVSSALQKYVAHFQEISEKRQRNEDLNKLQIAKLGESDTFLLQLGKILTRKNKQQYTKEQLKRIVNLYEGFTDGLSEEKSYSEKPRTKAFFGQLRSQRERSFQALQIITGESIDPATIHLGEINLEQEMDFKRNPKVRYNKEQLKAFTRQQFTDLFSDERDFIQEELSKFGSVTGVERQMLYAMFQKNKESAYARAVGGVCVAEDNPAYGKKNMWDMTNYFQLVFYDPATYRCQGLVLLHAIEDNGKKILTASPNPSSTYLYSVDEKAFFEGTMGILEDFAQRNQFDMIAFSQSGIIKTNRAGGEFENAMNELIADVNKPYVLSGEAQFSYNPDYRMKELDVVWEKPDN